MKVKIITFGWVAEILGPEFYTIAMDTDELMVSLNQKYPVLRDRKLLLAVNNLVIQENTKLKDNDTVAIMPPYSGG